MAETKQRSDRWYTWREDAKAFIDIQVVDKDARIDAYIAQASRYIERHTARRFIPWTGTREYDFQGVSQIILDDDLLSVTTLSDDGGAISSSNYFLYPQNAADYNEPYLWLELLFTTELFQFDDTKQQALTIAGKWGYSELTRSLTTINEGAQYSNSDTTLTVTDSSDCDIGMTLLIGSEQLFVRNISGNNLTVERAMNGTTAAAHNDGTSISVIEPPPDVQFACNVLVARWLHRADSAWSDRAGDPTAGFTYFKNMPTEVKGILDQYRRLVTSPLRPMGRESRIGRYG